MIEFCYVTNEMTDEVPFGRCYPGVIADRFNDHGVNVAKVRLRTGRTITVPEGILVDAQEYRLLDLVTADDEWATLDNVGNHRFLRINERPSHDEGLPEVMFA